MKKKNDFVEAEQFDLWQVEVGQCEFRFVADLRPNLRPAAPRPSDPYPFWESIRVKGRPRQYRPGGIVK